METFGDVEGFKKTIEGKYSTEIRKLEEATEERIQELREDYENRFLVTQKQIESETALESSKLAARVKSEKEIHARREFEQKREELIEAVFREVMERALKLAHSKQYVDYVKKRLPKDAVVVCDSSYYKKAFPKAKVDKSIVGVTAVSGNLVYNFTIDALVESKKEHLRNTAAKTLFGGTRK